MVRRSTFWGIVLALVLNVLPLVGGSAGANGAEIIVDDDSCTLYNGNGGIEFGDYFSVITHNKNGAGIARCEAQVTPSSTGKAVTLEGFDCLNPGLGLTTRSRESISPTGKATMTCLYPAT
jgi:hypothetical protein